jgi:hypothetical protein
MVDKIPNKDDPDVIDGFEQIHCDIEDIDRAVYNWVEKIMNIHATTNDGWKKVPVKWSTGERTFRSKEKQLREFKDVSGSLILPIITVARNGPIAKDLAFRGGARAGAVKSVPVIHRIKQDKTANFSNAHAKQKKGQINFRTRKKGKVVYQTISVPLPVYVTVPYQISLWSEYQEVMNEMTQPFVTAGGGLNYFVIEHNHHRFEVFVDQDFESDNNDDNMDMEERKYETMINLKVLGYLIGEGKNQKGSRVTITENAVEVKIPRERVIIDTANELNPDNDWYRE